MNPAGNGVTRRDFLAAGLAGGVRLATNHAGRTAATIPPPDKALIAITLDLEMSRNYPTWDQLHWDYEKGNLDAATKEYAVAAARRVKSHGGRIHYFAVGRVFEQESVAWLEEIVCEGHPVGNHTYDHVNVLATRGEELQFRFRRAPWLIHGKTPAEVIAENVRLTTLAMKQRLGIAPAGFRTPGGFHAGLADRPDVQNLLRQAGFDWVSSKYPAHPTGKMGQPPDAAVIDGIVKAQAAAQPFVYPSGLVEVPMSPISDVTAFRAARWKLEWFLEAIRAAVQWAIAERAAFDFLAHPSCLCVADPEFRTIELICELVHQAGDRATLADLGTIAGRAQRA
jgi:peptidoglycan/xylan/chitin deacetylase (PgdA/CDA1 family)